MRGACPPWATPTGVITQSSMDRLDGTIFKVVTLELEGPKTATKFGMKEVALKKYGKKYFTRLYISRYPFTSTNLLLAAMSFFFFPFSSKIPYAYFLNGLTPKKKKKTASNVLLRRTNKQCKQNLRFTTNANKIREILPQKFWLLSWTPPKISRNLRACYRSTLLPTSGSR